MMTVILFPFLSRLLSRRYYFHVVFKIRGAGEKMLENCLLEI